jgi:hypothetical protein
MRFHALGSFAVVEQSERRLPPLRSVLSLGAMNTGWLLIVICGALVGCSDAVTDAQWAKTVPGAYEVSQSGFIEHIDLKPDGSFRHDVSFDGVSLVAESGKWSFDVTSGAVSAEPFTSIWDDKSRKLTTNVVHWSVGALSVMRYGQAAERISPAVDFEYQLLRKKTNSTP